LQERENSAKPVLEALVCRAGMVKCRLWKPTTGVTMYKKIAVLALGLAITGVAQA
jgi:hypothetical protein